MKFLKFFLAVFALAMIGFFSFAATTVEASSVGPSSIITHGRVNDADGNGLPDRELVAYASDGTNFYPCSTGYVLTDSSGWYSNTCVYPTGVTVTSVWVVVVQSGGETFTPTYAITTQIYKKTFLANFVRN